MTLAVGRFEVNSFRIANVSGNLLETAEVVGILSGLTCRSSYPKISEQLVIPTYSGETEYPVVSPSLTEVCAELRLRGVLNSNQVLPANIHKSREILQSN